MIFDETVKFSTDQAITATAVSTNVVDLLATGTVHGAAAALSRDHGKSSHIPLLVQVTEDFDNLTSLNIAVQTSDTEGSGYVDAISEEVLLADLVAGKTSSIMYVPAGTDGRYMRLNYTVTGTNPAAGKITAGIVAGVQTNGVSV